MRIRTKFTLLQFISVIGFLASMFFVLLRFGQADNLKDLEFRAVTSLTNLKILENKTVLFGARSESLNRLWEDWYASYELFDTAYTVMLESRYHNLLGGNSLSRRDARADAWREIKQNEIKPIAESFDAFLPLAGEVESELADIETRFDIVSQFSRLRLSLVSRITIPTEAFIVDLRERVAQYSQTLFIAVITIVLLIQTGAILLSFLFARSFGRNITNLVRSLSEVAAGNFGVNIEIGSKDELEEVSNHFNSLIQDLWSRVESTKDMMRNIGSTTGEEVDLDALDELTLKQAMENTGADAGLLMGVSKGMLVLKQIQGYFPPPLALPPMVGSKREYVTEWFASQQFAPKEGLLGRVMNSGIPQFVRRNTAGELPDNADPESDLYINSAIFVPLNVAGTSYGVLALAFTRPDMSFTDLDYSYMRSYGEFVSLTTDNTYKYLELSRSHQINREIEVAADIQKMLLPEKMPVLSGAEAEAFSFAAKGVSGDYYDVIDLGEGKAAFVICDVAGKGVPASLLMIMIRTILRTISGPEKRSDFIMTELNRAITGSLGAERFATIALFIYDSEKQSISYSNGAHHPLYILRGDSRRYRKFDTEGLPMGIDVNAVFGHKRIKVHTGDYLVLFTDGLPEARSSSGEELGTERLLKFVARNADRRPVELAGEVREFIGSFTEGAAQHDDQTFLAVKVV